LYRLYLAQGKKAESEFSLKKADKAFQEYLKEDPVNAKARIGWAWVATNLKDFAKAEGILLQGKRINNDASINRALSDFYILQQFRAQQDGADLSQQLQFLNQAQKADPSYAKVYSSMMEIFVRGGRDEESRSKIRKKLQQIVASEQSSPMAHFALSNIIFQDGDQKTAIFHLEQAYEMDSSLISVMNNLAWMLAHSEPPDLDRALELSTAAVKRVPKDARCRDTLGTVLMKLGRNKEAIPHLEIALSGASDRQAVHQKLSATYKSLGMDELSQIHEKASLTPK
ncbi:MAG: tetratricopeptide repeat protein, partial [Mariniblastus sp.]